MGPEGAGVGLEADVSERGGEPRGPAGCNGGVDGEEPGEPDGADEEGELAAADARSPPEEEGGGPEPGEEEDVRQRGDSPHAIHPCRLR